MKRFTKLVMLSPNVSAIEPLARAAEESGADALSLVNWERNGALFLFVLPIEMPPVRVVLGPAPLVPLRIGRPNHSTPIVRHHPLFL